MAEQPTYIFSEFCLDPARRRLTRNGEQIDLSPKAFDVLLALIEQRGRTISKDELLNKVWDGQFVEENNLAVQVSTLRKAFGETSHDHRFIVTVPGRGYRFVSPVRYEDREPARPPRTEFVRSNGSPDTLEEKPLHALRATRPSRRNHLLWICLGILLVGGASAMYIWRGSSARSAATRSASPPIQISSARKVTNIGTIRTAALSPDGKMFLYSAGNYGETGLWLGHVDGGEHIQLRPPADAKYRGLAFAPDGKSVYYVVAEEQVQSGALYRSSILGGVPEKLRDIGNTQIALSPDGRQFAYVRNDPKARTSSLVIAEIEGANERDLASRPIEQAFEWRTLSWSPDGKRISVAATPGKFEGLEIFIVTVEDGEVKPLTAKMRWDEVKATEWLTDEAGILAVAGEKELWGDAQLYHVSHPDGLTRPVTRDLIAYGPGLHLSSDNKTLLTIQVQRNTNIWVAPVDDLTKAKQITFGSLERLDGMLDLTWTPDGKLIHSAIVDRAVTLWETDPKTGKQRQLTSASVFSHRPSTTDDGRFLVYESNRTGSPEIWRSNINGEDARQLTSGGENSRPHVSPDGRWVAFRKRDGFLWRTTIDGTDEIRLTEQPANTPRFSPDSKYIACLFVTDDELQKVAVLPIDGGTPIKVFDVPRNANFSLGIRWTPDGKALTYRDWKYGIWRQDINGGLPKQFSGVPKDARYAYDWSRDGRTFAFAPGQTISDLVLITLDKSLSH
jgi:DNA-binding winged helix-turn-helix (wHTH) protein/Tol biopolymer transport system component